MVVSLHSRLAAPEMYERGMILKAQVEAALLPPLIFDIFTFVV
jgi:hypothetical protein